MSKVTFTEAECRLAKEGLDFLINKGKFEVTAVEAFAISKKIAILAKIPALMEQYIIELKSVIESPPEEVKKGKK